MDFANSMAMSIAIKPTIIIINMLILNILFVNVDTSFVEV